jgi:hypothetical protein
MQHGMYVPQEAEATVINYRPRQGHLFAERLGHCDQHLSRWFVEAWTVKNN